MIKQKQNIAHWALVAEEVKLEVEITTEEAVMGVEVSLVVERVVVVTVVVVTVVEVKL